MASVTPGTLYVISAPSGAGKTSLVRELLARNGDMGVAISHTTRPPRPGEASDQHYHFVSEERFLEMVNEECFIEHALVFGYRYGTSKEALETLRAAGKRVILEIDVQGAEQVRSSLPGCISVFILPPSKATLRARLHARGQDAPQTIEKRLAASLEELSHYRDFDYLIVNDDFDRALGDLEAIIRQKPDRFSLKAQEIALRELLASLLSE